MLYRTLKKLKERNGLTDDLKNKIDVFFCSWENHRGAVQ